jgi:hypothetical protein
MRSGMGKQSGLCSGGGQERVKWGLDGERSFEQEKSNFHPGETE